MNKSIIKILFLISTTRINSKGFVPLYCRITYNHQRKQFATGLFVNPIFWKSKKQKVIPPNEDNDYINTQVSLIRTKFNQAFLLLQYSNESFDVDDIYLTYKGENVKNEKGIMELCAEKVQKNEEISTKIN